MKKMLAFLLALMMICSLACVPVSAEDTPSAPAQKEADFEPAQEPAYDWTDGSEAEVVEEDIFADWNPDAPALNALIDYVEAVTDEASADYIPVEDRIAVFDMDGTLCAELCPTYLEYYMLAWRILKDPSYSPDAEMLEFGRMLRDHSLDKSFPDHMDMLHATHAARAYAGMTQQEFADFVTNILVRPVDGFTGMSYANSFYTPMIEVVEYLQDNDFEVYVVSGSDRAICRTFLEGVFDIPYNHVIGMDVDYDATNLGDADGLDYVFKADDEVVRSDRLLIKNLKFNKVRQIVRDIGKQPVLSFGNSSGDCSMHNYTIFNNPYRSAAFMLIANDDERDYGKVEKAEKLGVEWAEDGYNVISMRDDFRTIYGDGVKKTGFFRWTEELAENRVPVEDSPVWVGQLEQAQDAEQLFVVAAVGETTAWVSMHEKDGSGNWKQIMTTPGYCSELGKELEGDGKTPVGTFRFNAAFGIANDPGCAIAYHQVDEDSWWSGDTREGYRYNQMVDIKDCPDLNTELSERIMDYPADYRYCLNVSYNEEGSPDLGSAIFLHCLDPQKPFTRGGIAIPQDQMLTVMQNVSPDCVVVIDSLENLSPETWADWGFAHTEDKAADDTAPAGDSATVENAAPAETETAARVEEPAPVEDTGSVEDTASLEAAAASDDSAAAEDTLSVSDLYTAEDLADAEAKIREEFDTWGCELLGLEYAGDDCCTDENLAWMNNLSGSGNFTQCAEFLSDFTSPKEGGGAWEPDYEYSDWQWWLARTDGGEWQLITWGY